MHLRTTLILAVVTLIVISISFWAFLFMVFGFGLVSIAARIFFSTGRVVNRIAFDAVIGSLGLGASARRIGSTAALQLRNAVIFFVPGIILFAIGAIILIRNM